MDGATEGTEGARGPDLRGRLQAALGESYTLERELGGGGMSRVFLAVDTRLGRRVVVKVLHPKPDDAAGEELQALIRGILEAQPDFRNVHAE